MISAETLRPIAHSSPFVSIGAQLRGLFRLALPMIVSRAGLATMGIADAIMVSRFSPDQFAALSLADGTLGRIVDVFAAFIMGGLVLVPRAFGSGNFQECIRIWKRSIPPALLLGLFGTLLGFAGTSLFHLAGQVAALANNAGRLSAILGFGYVAALLALGAGVFLEGIKRPTVVAVSIIGANILNLALNWLLISGHGSIAALGALGSALSTTVVRFMLAAVLVTFALKARSKDSTRGDICSDSPPDVQHRIGFSAAIVQTIMLVLSATLLVMAGLLGSLPLAVLAAIWSLNAPAMLIALGVADATSIRVAAADGPPRSVVTTSTFAIAVVIGLFAVTWILFPSQLASIFTHDVAMHDQLTPLIPLASGLILLDSCSFVIVSGLRGLRDIFLPTTIEVCTMAGLLPVAVWLTFRMNQGIRGLILAAIASAACRVGFLAWRFLWITKQSERHN